MKDLLKKWLNGTATWSEEKKLRQAAKQDHFLAEAMEGYDAFPINDHAAKIEQLKGRFRKSQKAEKGTVFSLARIAAAAAVIGVIGTLFWVQQEVEQPEILSQNAEKIETPVPQNSFEDNFSNGEANVVENSKEDNTTKNNTLEIENNKNGLPKPIVQQTPKPNKPSNTLKKMEIADPANEEMTETNIQPTVALSESVDVVPSPENKPIPLVVEAARKSEPAASAITKAPMPGPAMEKSRTSAVTARKRTATSPFEKINYYVGKVQNEDGQPLFDVKIIGLNTSFKTTTTIKGDFVLQANQPLNKIAVSKDGFHTRKIAINQYSDFLNVSLVKKSTTIPSDDLAMETIAPKPEEGLVNFFKYLAEHRKYPVGAKAKGIERDVEIRFYIDENGTPTDLKVTNPDIYGFDKEAIRLLKEGPKWQPANSHARYYVPFELE